MEEKLSIPKSKTIGVAEARTLTEVTHHLRCLLTPEEFRDIMVVYDCAMTRMLLESEQEGENK
jgi:hypothetical protein